MDPEDWSIVRLGLLAVDPKHQQDYPEVYNQSDRPHDEATIYTYSHQSPARLQVKVYQLELSECVHVRVGLAP